jgi:hypothetical protein
MINSRNLVVFTCFLGLLGCASNYRPPETAEEAMSRMRPNQKTTNLVPQIPQGNSVVTSMWTPAQQQQHSGRLPASVATQAPELSRTSELGPMELDQDLLNHSNKRLYFMTLHGQYEALRQMHLSTHGKDQGQVRHCPHFHSQLVGRSELQRPVMASWSSAKVYTEQMIEELKRDESALVWHPELTLSLSAKELTPRVLDMIRTDSRQSVQEQVAHHLSKAMAIHLEKTQTELTELCQTGASENYYIFENLVGHQKRIGKQATSETFYVLLKSSVVFNHAIISALGSQKTAGRSPASAQQTVQFEHATHAHHILERLEGAWAQDYFKRLNP